MLQYETLPPSLAGLLRSFRSCFTAPSLRTFSVLLAGMIAQPGRRTVCGMLTGAGLAGIWHHARAHWFFSRARWDTGEVGLMLFRLVVAHLIADDAPITLVVDDTLLRRSGRKVAQAGWHYDGAAGRDEKGRARTAWGNCWVVTAVVVTLPMLRRPVALPVAAALYPPRDASKHVLACHLVTRLAQALPDRRFHVVADCWYAGMDGAAGAARTPAATGRGLPANVTVTARLRANAGLTAIAAPVPGAAGRPRRIGARLGTPKHLAATAVWTSARVHRYGTTSTVELAEFTVLWYGVYRSRAVRVVLLREPDRPTRSGYHLALITTDLHTPATGLINRYATRWSIEVAFEDAKQITGVGQARNRTRQAVERTAPFGFYTQSIVILWYTLHGHTGHTVTHRRTTAPWYQTKTEPSYQDMITKLRRTLIAARVLGTSPAQPTDEELHTLRLTWAEEAA
ncbi:MAG TPA: transposase [Actinoplanes sp.]|nr:transposase [Actinoplanes sp.]